MLLAFNALVFTPWEGGIHSILIRNPVVVWHCQKAWIPDQVRDDNCGVRDDNCGVRDDNRGVRDDNCGTRDDS